MNKPESLARIQRVLQLRAEGWTYAAIGAEVGLSRSRVQQLLTRDRTPEQLEQLRARVNTRAKELWGAGVLPWAGP